MSTKIGTILGEEPIELDTDNVRVSHEHLLDNFTKLSILAIVAAYRQMTRVVVNDKFSGRVDLDELSRFVSYVVNHVGAPMVYDMKVSQDGAGESSLSPSEDFPYDVLLNFSGGIDSTAGLLHGLDHGKKVLPLWIDFGQPNKREEAVSIATVLQKLGLPLYKIDVDLGEQVKAGYAAWKHIVPGRNLLFVSLANALFRCSDRSAGSIYLCANKEETTKWKHRDKSLYYFRRCTSLFSRDTGKNIHVGTPFANHTKSEMLYWWKNHWEGKYGISPYETSTCYYDNKCGKCRACFRRTLALICGGYDVDPDIQVHPLTDPAGFIEDTWIPEINNGKRPRTAKLDFFISLERSKEVLSRKLLDYFERLPWQTRMAMTNRKREIAATKIE